VSESSEEEKHAFCMSHNIDLLALFLHALLVYEMFALFTRKMNSKLYIGNLSYSTTETELTKLFLHAGAVNSVWLGKELVAVVQRGMPSLN
jgi:hypothetical protein